MSEDAAAEDRTQDPTEKRLAQAREAGQLPTSRDLNMLACLAGGLVGGGMAGPREARALAEAAAALIATAVLFPLRRLSPAEDAIEAGAPGEAAGGLEVERAIAPPV